MNVTHTTILIITVVLAVLTLLLGWYSRMKRRSRVIRTELRRQYGGDVRLIAGCGIVDFSNRIPGVLALTSDRLVYRGVLKIVSTGGEIPLSSISELHFEAPSATRYSYARKYRRAIILGVHVSGRQKPYVFMLAEKDAPAWEVVLTRTTSSAKG